MTTPAAQVAVDLENPRPSLPFAPNALLPPANAGQVMQVLNHATAVQRIRLTLTSVKVSIADADAYGGTLLGYMPDKNFIWLGGEANLTWVKDGAGILTSENPKVAIGQAIATNATLSSTMSDLINGGSTGGSSIGTGLTGSVVMHSNDNATPALVFLDDAATLGIFLNSSVNPTGDGTILYSGTVDLYFIDLGNITS